MSNVRRRNMLGIPPTGTIEALAFWASFWPALYSGFGYSVLTGLIVGLVVVACQRKLERRAARLSYERDLSIARQRLRDAVACPDTFVIASATASVPPRAEAAMNVIRDLPISLWREELPRRKSLLNAIHDLQKSHSAFRLAALSFDAALTQFARVDNVRRGYATNMDSHLISYVLGSLQGFSPDELIRWINFGLERVNGWLEEGRASALADPQMVAAHALYRTRRHDLTASLDVLARELDA